MVAEEKQIFRYCLSVIYRLFPERFTSRVDAFRSYGIPPSPVVFIHLPKNGGSSVTNILYGRQIQHLTQNRLSSLGYIGPSSIVFATYRDPIQRFESACRYFLAGGTALKPVNAIAHPINLDIPRDKAEILERLEKGHHLDQVFNTQNSYLNFEDVQARKVRLIHLRDIDRFLHFLSGETLAPKINATLAPSLEPMKGAMIARVAELYQEDYLLEAYTEDIGGVDQLAQACLESLSVNR